MYVITGRPNLSFGGLLLNDSLQLEDKKGDVYVFFGLVGLAIKTGRPRDLQVEIASYHELSLIDTSGFITSNITEH